MVRSRVHITLLLYIVDVLFTSRVGLSAIHRSLGVATNRDNSGRKYYTTHCRSWSSLKIEIIVIGTTRPLTADFDVAINRDISGRSTIPLTADLSVATTEMIVA